MSKPLTVDQLFYIIKGCKAIPGPDGKNISLLDRIGENVNIVKTILQREDKFNGFTFLMVAAHEGRYQMAEALCTIHECPIDYQEFVHKRSALMIAALKGFNDTVRVLLQRGCNCSLKDIKGNTALDLAEKKAIKEMIEKHLKKPSKDN